MWAGDCRAGVIGEGESLPAVEATLKTSLTSEELSRVHKLKNLESLQTWVSINVRNSCYLHCLKAEKTSPVEGLKIGPILAKPPKSAKVVDFGNWHWFPQSIESNTPPLVLLDLWSSSFNWTTNINSNSSTMPNVHFLSTAPSCFKTYFPCFLQYAVLVTVPFTFVLLLSSGGGGKGGEPWGVGGPQPKKDLPQEKKKGQQNFRTLWDWEFWILHVGFPILVLNFCQSLDFSKIYRDHANSGWLILGQFWLRVLQWCWYLGLFPHCHFIAGQPYSEMGL